MKSNRITLTIALIMTSHVALAMQPMSSQQLSGSYIITDSFAKSVVIDMQQVQTLNRTMNNQFDSAFVGNASRNINHQQFNVAAFAAPMAAAKLGNSGLGFGFFDIPVNLDKAVVTTQMNRNSNSIGQIVTISGNFEDVVAPSFTVNNPIGGFGGTMEVIGLKGNFSVTTTVNYSTKR